MAEERGPSGQLLSTLELVKHDGTAHTPELDRTLQVPELDGTALGPQVNIP